MTRPAGGAAWWLLAPALACIVIFLVALGMAVATSLRPNAGMARLGAGWTLANYARFLSDPFFRGYLLRSLLISTYCTAIVAVLGFALAFAMVVGGAWLRVVITVVVVSQFFTAYVVRGFALIPLLGRTGLINQALLALGVTDTPLRILFTEFAVAVGLVVTALPYMVLPVYSALQAIPAELERAARSLGAGGMRIFWRITVPLAAPGLAAGVVLVFLFCFTAYVIPALLGGTRFTMIGNLVLESATESQDLPLASAAAIVALVVSMLASWLIRRGFARSVQADAA